MIPKRAAAFVDPDDGLAPRIRVSNRVDDGVRRPGSVVLADHLVSSEKSKNLPNKCDTRK